MRQNALSSALAGIILAASVLLSPSPASAHPARGGDFGLGLILNEPTGLTGKYFLSKRDAIDFHLGSAGWAGGWGGVGLYGDYLFHFDTGLRSSALVMPLYVGPGLGVIFNTDKNRYCTKFHCYYYDDGRAGLWLSVRVPLGLALWFKRFAGELFLEVVPTVYIIPGAYFDLQGALGFRFYF